MTLFGIKIHTNDIKIETLEEFLFQFQHFPQIINFSH